MTYVRNRPEISIGADPEVFARDRSTGLIVSAHELIPGSKEDPVLIPGDPNGGKFHPDGVAIEFGIHPAQNPIEFKGKITSAMRAIAIFIGHEKYELVTEPVVNFTQDYFNKLPSFVTTLGCSPEFNAYTGKVHKPQPVLDGPDAFMRTAGGHIHFGWTRDQRPMDKDHFNNCRLVVLELERMYTALMTRNEGVLEHAECKRQLMYGQPGAFRPTSYGVEWRRPSNKWLMLSSQSMTRLIDYGMGCVAKTIYATGENSPLYWTGFPYYNMSYSSPNNLTGRLLTRRSPVRSVEPEAYW